MDLDHIKSNWTQAGKAQKNKAEFLMMAQTKNHPKINRIRMKFIIEGLMLIAFLLIYNNAFDGANKPLWANIFLIVAAVLYILVRFAGWVLLRNPIRGVHLKKSLAVFHTQLKRTALAVLVTSLLFGTAVICFFTSSIDFTQEKYFFLIGMIISLIVLVYLSSRNWFKRVAAIKRSLAKFEDDLEGL